MWRNRYPVAEEMRRRNLSPGGWSETGAAGDVGGPPPDSSSRIFQLRPEPVSGSPIESLASNPPWSARMCRQGNRVVDGETC